MGRKNGAKNGEHFFDAKALGPVLEDQLSPLSIPLNRLQRHNLIRCFSAEGRYRRRLFRLQLEREWETQVAPAFDQENDLPGAEAMLDE